MNTADAPDYLGKFNAFRHQDGLASPKDASVRRKSLDAPYSWAWLDVRAEPVVVQLPAIPAGRFVVVQLYDLWGHNLLHVDAKTSGGKSVNVLVAGPGWKGAQPKGIDRVVRADTSLIGVTGRTAAATPGDVASVAALQQQFQIVPLSRFAKTAAPKAAPSYTSRVRQYEGGPRAGSSASQRASSARPSRCGRSQVTFSARDHRHGCRQALGSREDRQRLRRGDRRRRHRRAHAPRQAMATRAARSIHRHSRASVATL